MSLFRDYTMAWTQVVLLKVSLLCIGVAIGAYWHRAFKPLIGTLLVVGIALGLYLAYALLG